MPEGPRIALIHATRVAMEPVESAFAALWPEARTLSILEEGLSIDLAEARASREALDERIVRLAEYSRRLSPDAVLYTCSAFGDGSEQAARGMEIPVLKPNEAMFEAAIGAGGRIAMLYTFPPAAPGMEREFQEQAARCGSGAEIRSVFVPDALDALKSGDAQRHNLLVAQAAADLPGDETDALMLAHFSMTRAVEAVRGGTALPVFTSPETAVAKLQRALMRSGAE